MIPLSEILFSPNTAQIVNCNISLGPVSKYACRVERGNNFDCSRIAVLYCKKRSSPSVDAIELAEPPKGDRSESDNDVGLDKANLLKRKFDSLLDDRVNGLAEVWDIARLNIFLSLGNPSANVAAIRALADDVGQEAFGSSESGLVQHAIEFEAGLTRERHAGLHIFFGGNVSDNHDLSIGGTGGSAGHFALPLVVLVFPDQMTNLRRGVVALAIQFAIERDEQDHVERDVQCAGLD